MVVRRIDYLTEAEKRQYRERSKMAVNGIDVLLRNLYLITSKGNITEKYRTIAQYIGLVPDGNSHYNYFIPVQQDIVFLLRLSNHNNENEELYNQHEQKGHPDVRFILFFQGSGYSLLFSGVFCEAKHYVYNYPINGLDSEEDVIRFLSSLRELFIKGQAIFRGADAPEPRQTNNDIISQWNRTIDRNNESKTNKNMKKNVVRLNEQQLKKIVAESVKKVLKEYNHNVEDWWRHNGSFDREQASGIPYMGDDNYLQKTDEWWESLSDKAKMEIYNEYFNEY